MDGKSQSSCIMQFRFGRGDVKLFFSANFKAFKKGKKGNMKEHLILKKINWKFVFTASPSWGRFYKRLV